MTLSLLTALLPIALLIVLGAWLKRSQFLADNFWAQAERLAYYVLLPSLFFHGLATAKLDGVPFQSMVSVLIVSTVVVSLMLVSARALITTNDAAFTSIFQGGIRFNNYVGVSIAAGLFGVQGIALAAVANAAIVPTVNILCVLVFAKYGAGGRMPLSKVLKQLALNPLLLSCLAGGLIQVTGLGLPIGIEPVLKALGQASLPLGLLCVGAALEFGSMRQWLRPVGYSSLVKFLVMPLVTLGACHLFGLEGKAAIAALLFQALPTASSSYIMARQLGGDAPLMAGIIACQTLLAGVALPIVILAVTQWV
ncbi:AEC family transporter [Pseudomonas sp. CFBP 13727]|jgi:malonate transporter|uniref:AEC family transporter n=1 Tax=Pseudomonas sp. CFBP 13727 TaxID=2775295 RepID=UPI0017867CC8|nr:AEC family transporter [Pseudomonas sp. CFBP 13727]MBD8623412.1 AEC family transporter [Pseudomonas sp. CFBP 13727]